MLYTPADFILVCDSVEFLRDEHKYTGAHINKAKHREFAVLLLLQVIAVFMAVLLLSVLFL